MGDDVGRAQLLRRSPAFPDTRRKIKTGPAIALRQCSTAAASTKRGACRGHFGSDSPATRTTAVPESLRAKRVGDGTVGPGRYTTAEPAPTRPRVHRLVPQPQNLRP